MKFYKTQHKYYCGVDLHARKMYVCILAQNGKVMVHQNIKTDPERFFKLFFPFIEDVVVGVECVFCWYWLADLCADQKIDFVLGHALYMQAIHHENTTKAGPWVSLRTSWTGPSILCSKTRRRST